MDRPGSDSEQVQKTRPEAPQALLEVLAAWPEVPLVLLEVLAAWPEVPLVLLEVLKAWPEVPLILLEVLKVWPVVPAARGDSQQARMEQILPTRANPNRQTSHQKGRILSRPEVAVVVDLYLPCALPREEEAGESLELRKLVATQEPAAWVAAMKGMPLKTMAKAAKMPWVLLQNPDQSDRPGFCFQFLKTPAEARGTLGDFREIPAGSVLAQLVLAWKRCRLSLLRHSVWTEVIQGVPLWLAP